MSEFLDVLGEAAAARLPPVEVREAQARLRASFSPEQLGPIEDPSRFVASRTARSAGKTASMVADAILQMSTIKGWRGCYGAMTKDAGIEQLWDEIARQNREYGFGLKFATSDDTVVHRLTGGRLKIRSIDTRRAVDKWRGKQYHRIYLDECQSIADEVLRYAIVQALPHTLARYQGSMRLAGTPRLDCSGWWYAVTGPDGLVAQRMPDGSVRALARPWTERDLGMWSGVNWSWSLHNWARSANPGLPHADRESDTMRRALAATEADRMAIAVEIDGEWPTRDEEARLFRGYDPVLSTWVPGPAELNYGLPEGHDWSFFLGADLAIKWDLFALTLGACAPTHRVAFHCDEFGGARLSTGQMADEINRFRSTLGRRLHAIVGDSQGPTGHWIFDELTRVHHIPLEHAKKRDKDDGVELVSSDLAAGRMMIKAGSQLAVQLRELRRKKPDQPASKQHHQRDDFADAWIYTRRRMTHMFTRDPAPPPDEAQQRLAIHQRDMRAMQRRLRLQQDPWSALRTVPFPMGGKNGP